MPITLINIDVKYLDKITLGTIKLINSEYNRHVHYLTFVINYQFYKSKS